MIVSAPTSITVPGRLTVTAQVAPNAGAADLTGFVVLTHGADTRRIPYWVEVSHPALAKEPHVLLAKPGLYEGNTAGGATRVDRYRYPTGGTSWAGPEVVYRVRLAKKVANFGVAVVSGRAVPHVVYAGDESHLVGYAGLPQSINPYVSRFGQTRPIAGAVLPLPGTFDVVFDTRSKAQAGPFSFRFWVNDTQPPTLRRGRQRSRDDLDLRDRCRRRRRPQVRHRDAGRARVRYSAGRFVVQATRDVQARRLGLRLPGGQEHGGRRHDHAEHGDPDQRPGRLETVSGVLLVGRRQRGEVALDRPDEVVGVRRDDLQLLLAARAIALTARILAQAARDPRPLLCTRHERHGRATSRTTPNGLMPERIPPPRHRPTGFAGRLGECCDDCSCWPRLHRS